MKDLKVTVKIEGVDKELNFNVPKKDIKTLMQVISVFNTNKDISKVVDEYIPKP